VLRSRFALSLARASLCRSLARAYQPSTPTLVPATTPTLVSNRHTTSTSKPTDRSISTLPRGAYRQ
jgi:hypothetical protein